MLVNLVSDVLEADAKICATGLHRHVDLVISEQARGGSVRQSLELAVDIVVTRAITVVIHAIDCNFNLATLDSVSLDVWLSLANCPAIVDGAAVARTSLSSSNIGSTIHNTGQHGPLVALFPFSWRIVSILEATRERAQTGDDPVALMASVASSIFGPVAILTKHISLCN